MIEQFGLLGSAGVGGRLVGVAFRFGGADVVADLGEAVPDGSAEGSGVLGAEVVVGVVFELVEQLGLPAAEVPDVLGELVGGLLLVVLGAVLAAAGGIFAVAGVAGGGAVVALLALLHLARVDPPATIGTARLLAAQVVVLAALVTGVALAVFGPPKTQHA